ncbi:MAG: nucleotide exchange factor GrpE [Buchnera aphidicola (Ceratovacuna japonica)]
MEKENKISLENKIKIIKLENKELILKNNKILKKIKKLDLEILKRKVEIKKNLNRSIKKLNVELENSYKFSLENLILDFLPVMDSLEIAVQTKNNIKNIFVKKFLNKLENVLKNFIKMLNEFKVFEIKNINVKFNPNIHQAISISFSKKLKNNFIINIVQKGYLLYERLLRPAMVIVNKKK